MSRFMQYSLASVVLGSAADHLGASMPVSLMVALIGPPLLHIAWLVYRGRT